MKSWDLSSLFNGQMVTQFQIVNNNKLWWQYREFLTRWMRKSEGGELWGGVEVGDRTGFKEEQGVAQRGVGSCSWILSAAAHSSPTCWDSFLTCTLTACKSCGNLAVHQGSSVAFFFFLLFLSETVFLCETKPGLYKNASDGNFGHCCTWKWGHGAPGLFSSLGGAGKRSLFNSSIH